jgi:hypothetical protein
LVWHSLILEDNRIRRLNCLILVLSFQIYYDSRYINQSIVLIHCIKRTRIHFWNTASYYNCYPQWESSLESRAPSPSKLSRKPFDVTIRGWQHPSKGRDRRRQSRGV